MTQDNPITGMDSVTDIINEWSTTHPAYSDLPREELDKMIARRMELRVQESLPRRMYYDLFEFKVRGW